MGQAVKCASCGSFYNGAIYVNCPYCKNKNVDLGITENKIIIEKNETPKEHRGFFLRKKTQNNAENGIVQDRPHKEIYPKADISSIPIENEILQENNDAWNVHTKNSMTSVDAGMPETTALDYYSSSDNEIPTNGNSMMDIGIKEAPVEEKQLLDIENIKKTPSTQDRLLNDIKTQLSANNQETLNIAPNNNEAVSEQNMTAEVKENSLQQQIGRVGRTVGTYIYNNSGEAIQPVVGWLVGTKGAYAGESFELKKGRNRIGRSNQMDIKLLNDTSISRECVGTIIYDVKSGVYTLLPGESDSLCYINGEALYERMQLNGFEKLEFGDSELNCFRFVPFCGEQFSYAEYELNG